MTKNFKIFGILVRTFGFKMKFVFLILFRFSIELLITITMFLDSIFFPGYKKAELKNPIFLIGHPRSGTTFLHRFFEKNCSQIRTTYLWEMLFPSIILRKLLKPFKKQLSKISLDKVWDPKIHKTNLLAAETEDIALYFRYYDGFLSWIYYSLWDKDLNSNNFRQKLMEKCDKDKFILYLRKIHQRNLYIDKKRMFSKSFALLFNIETIKKVYPDVKILLMMRDPVQAIASFMSLEKFTQNSLFGLLNLTREKQMEYYEGIYNTSLIYYKRFHEILQENKDSKSIIFISHKQLLGNFSEVLDNIINEFGLVRDEEFDSAIQEQVKKQMTFKSEHKYSLDEFGIDETRIKNDFAFIYDNYDL
jgi:hypothetical protein